jgi:hypothetical protein
MVPSLASLLAHSWAKLQSCKNKGHVESYSIAGESTLSTIDVEVDINDSSNARSVDNFFYKIMGS